MTKNNKPQIIVFADCTGGTKLVQVTGGNADCAPCPLGTYQTATDVNLCRTCPDGYNTSDERSVELSSCLRK